MAENKERDLMRYFMTMFIQLRNKGKYSITTPNPAALTIASRVSSEELHSGATGREVFVDEKSHVSKHARNVRLVRVKERRKKTYISLVVSAEAGQAIA